MPRKRVVREYIGAIPVLIELANKAEHLRSIAYRHTTIEEDERLDFMIQCVDAFKALGFTSGDVSSIVHMSYEQEEPLPF
jgi:hypothetical protein